VCCLEHDVDFAANQRVAAPEQLRPAVGMSGVVTLPDRR
jgi:hypothetical protein